LPALQEVTVTHSVKLRQLDSVQLAITVYLAPLIHVLKYLLSMVHAQLAISVQRAHLLPFRVLLVHIHLVCLMQLRKTVCYVIQVDTAMAQAALNQMECVLLDIIALEILLLHFPWIHSLVIFVLEVITALLVRRLHFLVLLDSMQTILEWNHVCHAYKVFIVMVGLLTLMVSPVNLATIAHLEQNTESNILA
jgi:hypothetical protein